MLGVLVVLAPLLGRYGYMNITSKRTSAGKQTSRGRWRPTVPSGLPTACRLLNFMMYVLAISRRKSNRDSWFLFSLGPHLCKYHALHRATSTQNAKRPHHHFLLRMEMRYRFRLWSMRSVPRMHRLYLAMAAGWVMFTWLFLADDHRWRCCRTTIIPEATSFL